MALTITAADAYIGLNVIDTEGWEDSDAAKKQRMLNVAERTLNRLYSKYTIPDEAVYEFAAALSVVFSDTMVQAQRGIQSTSISGAVSVSFGVGERKLAQLVPQSSRDIIGDENGVKISAQRFGRLIP
ncbi:hypothetical protein [Paenibacillus xylanilyticus]|uniref:hypothetical protein n=1 Tax=Paenibacillus xylanilyticus TaxID=248903 RepID=UPI00129E60E1|nr:hypothetical protein [Paenibacillus xylanilyticus]